MKTFELGSNVERPYTQKEMAAFSAISAGDRLTTTQLTSSIYSRKDRPFSARQATLSVMLSLQRKVKENDEPFEIKRGRRVGPFPIEFWIEQRR